MPRAKLRYSGMMSSVLMKTRLTLSLMLLRFFLVSKSSKGALLRKHQHISSASMQKTTRRLGMYRIALNSS